MMDTDLALGIIGYACDRYHQGEKIPFFIGDELFLLELVRKHIDLGLNVMGYCVMGYCEAYLVNVSKSMEGRRDGVRHILRQVDPQTIWETYLQSQVISVHAV